MEPIQEPPIAIGQDDFLTPKKIVSLLDRYIVGQDQAKKSVAIALRNRIRRQRLNEKMRKEIIPKNILMMGPTGVGKTEIARRLAQISKSPFIKVEASRFTEVGYVGRSVESMIRDLVEASINMIKSDEMKRVKTQAEIEVEKRILDALTHTKPAKNQQQFGEGFLGALLGNRAQPSSPQQTDQQAQQDQAQQREDRDQRATIREQMEKGLLEDRDVELEIEQASTPSIGMIGGGEMAEEMGIDLQGVFGNLIPKKKVIKRMKVREARQFLFPIEAEKLIDMDKTIQIGLDMAQERGIIFLDEIDKVVSKGSSGSGPDVSREGVQRDLLPIVEGTNVMTKYGMVRTDYILFIAAGAFHMSKPSDLIPEFQGRFPIRVELDPLTVDDFERIVVEPENSLLKQYTALLDTDGVSLQFSPEGIREIAQIAFSLNEQIENIGARRLYTVLEKILEDVSFEAPEIDEKTVQIDPAFVQTHLASILKDEDLSSYIL